MYKVIEITLLLDRPLCSSAVGSWSAWLRVPEDSGPGHQTASTMDTPIFEKLQLTLAVAERVPWTGGSAVVA